jgi:hypothetical protein
MALGGGEPEPSHRRPARPMIGLGQTRPRRSVRGGRNAFEERGSQRVPTAAPRPSLRVFASAAS